MFTPMISGKSTIFDVFSPKSARLCVPMVVGVFLKNFKCYQGIQHVPSFSHLHKGLVAYLGDNGVGKSAVLEGLQTFFSKKPHWLRNKESKKGAADCFIGPVFLLNKTSVPDVYGKFSKELAKNLKLEVSADQILICVARREDGAVSIFDGKKELDIEGNKKIAEEIYKHICSVYQYIYINAEVDIDEQAKVNSDIYELIIGSSIIGEVEKRFKESDTKSQLIENLNKTLGDLIDEKFTNRLKQADQNYSYGSNRGAISKLTMNMLARVSTEAFLYSRKLKYKGKQLEDLSSGQRRTALLDFIIAVLDNKAFDPKKNLILAIDEPEISLDTGKKMQQFEKLTELTGKEVSIMFTSHWYGWMVFTNAGQSILIEEEEGDGRRVTRSYINSEFPFRDIAKYEMRMVFDFLMALGASAETNKEKKFIICEGESDLSYLEGSLNSPDYKVIPVGKARVQKISNIFKDYYWKDAGPLIGNVLFLIDTDPQNKDPYDNPYLRRWAKNDDLNVTLINGGENAHNKCCIENTLEPDFYLESLKEIYKESDLIQGLNIVHDNLRGFDSFGMDAVKLRNFERETKAQKSALAKKYKELISAKPRPKNALKRDIEAYFSR